LESSGTYLLILLKASSIYHLFNITTEFDFLKGEIKKTSIISRSNV